MLSDAVLTTVITIAGGLLTLYITYRLKNLKPKSERIDTAFGMYEAILKRQNEEIKRLTDENIVLRAENERLREGNFSREAI